MKTYQHHTFGGKYQTYLSNKQYELFMAALKEPRARVVLNELKQQALTNTISALFGKLFPNAPFTKQAKMLIMPVKDVSFVSELKLVELGVSRKTIIRKLMSSGILPENFYKSNAA